MSTIVFTSAVLLGALAVAGWVAAVADSAPNLNERSPEVPGGNSQVFASDGSSLGFIHSTLLRSPVPAYQIPTALKHATVAIEDRRFYHHGALDYQGILRAAVRDVFNGGSTLQGASTLTMQLANQLYLPHHKRDLKYKIIQAKLAQQLEKAHSKDWILHEYLNDVPYGTVGGQTAYGVGAASQIFFDKPVSQLDLAQSALLAGMPQAPSQYNPFITSKLATKRRRDVLQAMVKSGYIKQSEADASAKEPLGIKRNDAYGQRRQPYAFDYVVEQLHQRFCPGRAYTASCPKVDQGGLKIHTTINLQDQQQAQSAVVSHEGGSGNPAAALVSIDPTNGHVLAIANTSEYSQSSFDYATQGQRQPGSSFKVYALMTLIHDYGGDPNQTFYNSHFLAPGWLPGYPTYSVHTAEQTYQGNIDITHATIVSDNTVFAQLAVDLGMDKIDAMAHAMGITTKLDGNPAEVIGGLTLGVTPLEMADAYATVANGGWHVPATAIDKVVFPDGSTVNMGAPPRKQVFSTAEASAAIDVLKQVITNSGGTGTAANYGCPAAGKTGTAENLENAWFVGFTPKLSTAVWVGYPNANTPMSNGFGGTLAAPIWHDYMQSASNGFCGDWSQPSSPWHGTAFTGPHSGPSGPSGPNNGNGNGNGNGSGNQNGGGGAGNAYNNPQLYAKPPQGPPHVRIPNGGSTGGAPPAGFGTGRGGSGGGGARKTR
jgi:penicillin-binding protein 1A